MNDEVNSAWRIEVDLEKGQIRRVRNFSRDSGVPALPLEKKLREVFVFVAGLAEMGGDEFSANVIEKKSDELAYGWARVARENDRVKLVIQWIVTTNAWTDAIVPTVLVGGAVAWHYDLMPNTIGERIAKFSGAVPMTPEEEAELQKQAAQMQAMMEREAEEAAAAAPETDVKQSEPEDDEPEDSSTQSPSVVPLPPDAPID